MAKKPFWFAALLPVVFCVLGLVLLYLLQVMSSQRVVLFGLAVDENGRMQSGLQIVAFVEGFEVARGISAFSSELEGRVASVADMEHGLSNFTISLENEFGYVAEVPSPAVYLDAGIVSTTSPAFFLTPLEQAVRVLVLPHGQGEGPLMLDSSGRPIAIPETHPYHDRETRLSALDLGRRFIELPRGWLLLLTVGALLALLPTLAVLRLQTRRLRSRIQGEVEQGGEGRERSAVFEVLLPLLVEVVGTVIAAIILKLFGIG